MDYGALRLFQWFQGHGGVVDEGAIGLSVFTDTGRGAVALRELQEGEELFRIPRSLLLSTRTSRLPILLGADDWGPLKEKWAGLILCMMWEESRGSNSEWHGYLASMPSKFDTLMFWTDEELEELLGSTVIDKIGKAEAESTYRQILLPLVQRRSELFKPELVKTCYSLEMYHVHGSRILSRSFNVERWKDDNAEQPLQVELKQGGDDDQDQMDSTRSSDDATEISDSDTLEGDGGVEDVSMVPMADMLNARFGSDNARLFYHRDALAMVCTRPIQKGEEIFNTYGEPPNSELLRRYGHIDLVPIPEGLGNPADVVEIKADIILETTNPSDSQAKLDFFLDEGGDDIFVIAADEDLLPEDFVAFVRLLTLTQSEWAKARAKGRLPKAKVDLVVLENVRRILVRRLACYQTTMEDDEDLLRTGLSARRVNAVHVRLGEKRILHTTLSKVSAMIQTLEASPGNNPEEKKRKGGPTQRETSTKRPRNEG